MNSIIKKKIKQHLLESLGNDILICQIRRLTRQACRELVATEKSILGNRKCLRVNIASNDNIYIQEITSKELPKPLSRQTRYYSVKYRINPNSQLAGLTVTIEDEDPRAGEICKPFIVLSPSLDTKQKMVHKKFYIANIGDMVINELFHFVSDEPFVINPVYGDVVIKREHYILLKPLVLKTLDDNIKTYETQAIPSISLVNEIDKQHIEKVIDLT